MADLTPPRSQSNTPVRPMGTFRNAPTDIQTSPTTSGLHSARALVDTELDTSPERGDSDDEKMEEDQLSPDEGDDGSDTERAAMEQELEQQGLVIKPDVAISSAEEGGKNLNQKRTAQGAPTTPKGSKGKKKDTELLESNIVARWNRDFGDVCAHKPKP